MTEWNFLTLLASNAYNTGQNFGKIFVIVMLLAGICKCVTIAKRQTTSWKCVYGLALNLLAWLFSASYYLIPAAGIKSFLIIIVVCVVVFGMAFTGLCLAVYGLIEYHFRPEYQQGRKQAISAVLVFFFLIGSITLGFIAGYKNRNRIPPGIIKEAPKSGELVFDKFNFKFHLPGKPWVEVNPKKFSKDAAFVLMRNNPQMTFIVIAEKISGNLQMDLDTLVEVSKGNLKSVAKNVKITDEKSHTVKGLNGIRFYSEAEIGNYKYAYTHWLYGRGGYYYQLITCGDQKNVELVRKEAEMLAANFELINKNLPKENTQTQPELTGNKQSLKPNKSSEFKELNFKFSQPGRPWVAVDAKKFNPDASLALMRAHPQIIMMIIAEKSGEMEGIDTPWLVEVSKANLKGSAKQFKIVKEGKYNLNGIEGFRFYTDVELDGNMKLAYVHWVSVHNGYFYQLVIFGDQKDRQQVDKDAEKLFKDFSLIDPQKIAVVEGGGTFGTFKSDIFGYSIDLKNTTWQKWPDLNKESPIADTGGLAGAKACFIMIPFIYEKGKYPPKTIIKAMLFNLNSPDPSKEITVINNIRENHMEGLICRFERKIDQQVFDYRIKILCRQNCAYMIMVWAEKGYSELNALSEQVFKSVSYSAPGQFKTVLKSLSFHQKKNLAVQFNNIGLVYFDNQQFDKSLQCFQWAHNLDVGNKIYTQNVYKAQNALRDIVVEKQKKQAAEQKKKIAEQKKKIAEEKTKAKKLHEKQQEELISQLVPDLFRGKFKKAEKKFRNYENHNSFPDIQKIIKDADAADKLIIDSLKNEIGEKITVEFNGKSQTVKLKKIKGSKIYYDKSIGKAKVTKYFKVKNLSVKEKNQRLGEINDIAKALYLGSEAVKDDQYTSAEKFFRKAGIFAKPMLKRLVALKQAESGKRKK